MKNRIKCFLWLALAVVIITSWVWTEWKKWDAQQEFKDEVRSFISQGKRFTVEQAQVLCDEINRIEAESTNGIELEIKNIDCKKILDAKADQ